MNPLRTLDLSLLSRGDYCRRCRRRHPNACEPDLRSDGSRTNARAGDKPLTPHVQALGRRVDERLDELRRIRERGSSAVDPRGVNASDVLAALRAGLSNRRVLRDEVDLDHGSVLAILEALEEAGLARRVDVMTDCGKRRTDWRVA